MGSKKINMYFLVFFIGLLFITLTKSESVFSLILSFVFYFFIGRLVNSRSSIHMMFFLGFSIFIFLPTVLNWYYLDVSFELFFLSSFIAAFFLFLTRDTQVKKFIDYGFFPKFLFVLLSLVGSLLAIIGYGSFVTPVFAFLIILLSLSFKQNNIKNNSIFIFIFIVFFLVYAKFAWSGFGRTVVISWLLLALLQFAYSINYKVNKYVFGLAPGVGATLLSNRNIFKFEFSGFENALNDSAYGPYRTASTFIDYFNQRGFDLSGFWDQILFAFFVYIPRAIWPSKPYGFGFEYTVRHLDAYLADAGHSIASTLIGDHIYYLGYFGIISSLLIFLIIALITNALYKVKGLNGNGVLLFSASMLVLVWGGMTSFSARVALPSIVFVLLFTFFRRFLTRKVRFVWGASN